MNNKVKQTFANIFSFAFIAFVVVMIIIGMKSCWNTYGKSYSWQCDVDITYVYENDSIEHHIKTTELLSANRSVDWVDVSYAAPAGYNNVLILYTDANYNGRHHNCYQKELMRVPDKKFKVTDIKWKLGERQDKD